MQITSGLKVFNGGDFACNGRAFFWVAVHDVGGEWSNAVVTEVKKTAGCSKGDSLTQVPSNVPSSVPSMSDKSSFFPGWSPTGVPSMEPSFDPATETRCP